MPQNQTHNQVIFPATPTGSVWLATVDLIVNQDVLVLGYRPLGPYPEPFLGSRQSSWIFPQESERVNSFNYTFDRNSQLIGLMLSLGENYILSFLSIQRQLINKPVISELNLCAHSVKFLPL